MENMSKIVDIQFREYGKIYAFDPGHFVLKKGDKILVETEQGQALGTVCAKARRCEKNLAERPLKKILRLAVKEDLDRYARNCRMEKDVYAFCYERINARSLPMCLVSVERLFDGSKVMVYFTADGRVDFRELVKDLVQKFHSRIEMRQIGVRYQAKMVGGLGNCGRPLCCTSFLGNFGPVSIKMAKEQNLSLNPTKISGMCGRLMCCLAYEYDYYERVKKDIPKVGKRVKTLHGDGKVIRQNVLKQTLSVLLDSSEEREIPFSEIVRNEIVRNGPPRAQAPWKGRKKTEKE
jgi:cell fate regulator YaaT (PSP1 superfamily)